MKKRKNKLAEAEWEVMDAVWDLGRPVTVRQVHQYRYGDGRKAYTTVQTTMNILVDKGYLSREKIGMVNLYRAKFTRQQAARNETRNLVSRIFDGSFGALAHYLVESGELSAEELAELKALIEKREKHRGGRHGRLE